MVTMFRRLALMKYGFSKKIVDHLEHKYLFHYFRESSDIIAKYGWHNTYAMKETLSKCGQIGIAFMPLKIIPNENHKSIKNIIYGKRLYLRQTIFGIAVMPWTNKLSIVQS